MGENGKTIKKATGNYNKKGLKIDRVFTKDAPNALENVEYELHLASPTRMGRLYSN